MVKNAVCLFVFGFCGVSLLSAEEGFLAGAKAEDLRLAGIETRIEPSDTVGYGEAGVLEFFFPLDSTSPDEKRIVYSKNGDDPSKWGVCLKNMGTGEVRFIAPGGFMPQWSSLGDLVAYLKGRPLPGQFYEGRQLYGEDELWIIDPEGGNSKNLTPGLDCNHFAWSPQGDLIAVDVLEQEEDILDILFVVDPRTGVQTALDTVYVANVISFSWAPNSKVIAYTVDEKIDREPVTWDRRAVDSEVFLINADGTGKTQLTDTPEVEGHLKWMPDGKRILVERIDPSYETDWKLVYLVLETVK